MCVSARVRDPAHRFSQMNGILVANVTNKVYVLGATGFLSAGVGVFDDAILNTVCDGGDACVGTLPLPAVPTRLPCTL